MRCKVLLRKCLPAAKLQFYTKKPENRSRKGYALKAAVLLPQSGLPAHMLNLFFIVKQQGSGIPARNLRLRTAGRVLIVNRETTRFRGTRPQSSIVPGGSGSYF